MNARHVTRIMSVAFVLAVLSMGAALDWPIWLWFLLPALCAAMLLIDMRVPRSEGRRTRHTSEPEDDVPEPPVESPYQETTLVAVPVESTVADCPFLFSAMVWWRPVDEGATSAHGNPAALAAASVLQRVRETASVEHPGRCTYLERELEGALGTPMPDDTRLVIAFATDIRLVLRQRDREYLEELETLRKATGAWESRRQHERDVREYLGDDVMQSPGSAVVWWMARHEDQIERAVEMIAPLTVLSAAANDEEIPEAYRGLFQAPHSTSAGEPVGGFEHPLPFGEESLEDDVPGAAGTQQQGPLRDNLSVWLDELGLAEGSAERTAFQHRLARMSDVAGRPEAAERIRINMSREAQDDDLTVAESFEDDAEKPASATSSAYSPPWYAGRPSEGEQQPSGRGWQVTSEGLVSKAGEAAWPEPEDLGQDSPGPDREGDER